MEILEPKILYARKNENPAHWATYHCRACIIHGQHRTICFNTLDWNPTLIFDGASQYNAEMTILGANGAVYKYRCGAQYAPHSDAAFPADKRTDVRLPRKLIVHTTLPYTALICPYVLESSDALPGVGVYVINLEMGAVVETPSEYLRLYESFETSEKAAELLHKYYALGYAEHYMTVDVVIFGEGFTVAVELCDYNENITNQVSYTIALK